MAFLRLPPFQLPWGQTIPSSEFRTASPLDLGSYGTTSSRSSDREGVGSSTIAYKLVFLISSSDVFDPDWHRCSQHMVVYLRTALCGATPSPYDTVTSHPVNPSLPAKPEQASPLRECTDSPSGRHMRGSVYCKMGQSVPEGGPVSAT